MLRTLVVLLLAANVGFLAWTQGWWPAGWLPPPADGEHQREPERLAAQVRPESIELLDAQAARRLSAALCLQAGPFTDEEWPAAEAAAAGAGLPAGAWQRLPAATPAEGHWMRVPEADTALQAALQGVTEAALAGGFKPCP